MPSPVPLDVPDGAAFDAWRLEPLDARAFALLGGQPTPNEAQLRYVAALALLAPSTHNTVPLRMRLDASAGALHFAVDRRAVLPQSDPVGRQATISVGAAVANAALAAQAYGLAASVDVHAEAEPRVRPPRGEEASVVPVATLTLRAGAGTPPGPGIALVQAMLRRKMVRAEYDERVKLDPALTSALTAVAARTHPGLALHLVADAPTLLALGKFQELADSTVINRVPFARELGDWLLDNDSEDAVGMRGREFGLSDEAARRFHAGLRGRGPLLPDETVAFAKAGNLGMRSSSAVAVITTARDDLEHRLAAGRAFEEMTLLLSLAGYAVAMHAGITEVDAPNMALRGRLRTLQRPTVVFRIGKPLRAPDGERPHASRPPLDTVLY